MKPLALVMIFCASAASAADQSADREAIKKTVLEMRVFTADFDSRAELARLRIAKPMEVVISTEPWGEATISMPVPAFIVVRNIRFLTPEVAIVDAAARVPLLIVLRKEEPIWKIASLRILAQN